MTRFITTTDSAFRCGASHPVCQDYATSGTKDGLHYAIVADGCSSSPNTDFGARLIASSAVKHLRLLHEAASAERPEALNVAATILATTADVWRESLQLPQYALDATLVMAIADDQRVSILVFGDGAVYVKMRNGDELMWEYSFGENYPAYLSYHCDSERMRQFLGVEKNDYRISATSLSQSGNGETLTHPLDHPMIDITCHPLEDVESIVVLSDGVQSFQRHVEKGTSLTTEPIQATSFVQELCGFKNMKGEFVQRRINRFLKDAAANGWQHYDDLSMAAIHARKAGHL